jgi:intein-encoded DNA endonuclease-like protein
LRRYFDVVATGPYLKIRAGSMMERRGKVFKRRKSNYYMAISRRRHVERFLCEIGFSITEKQQGLPRRE